MDERLEKHRRVAVAVLESLRATVYPSYQLRPIAELPDVGDSEIGWALGADPGAGAAAPGFEPYLVVRLVSDEQGNPVHFECWDRHGQEAATPEGDLSKQSLVQALETLHQERPDPTESIWRWLGRGGRPTRGKNRT
jgi:hypothetical protein